MQKIILKAGREKSLKRRHPWIFSGAVAKMPQGVDPGESVEVHNIDLMILPASAIDRQGNRLGKGKGYYDRFLDGYRGLRIGVGFEWQFSVTPLPHEPHDQHLDIIVTELETRDFRR